MRDEPETFPAVMVGRQPILDRRRQVFGYELRFRPLDPLAAAEFGDAEAAARNITDAVVAIGLDKLTHGRRAFITVPVSLLKHDLAKALPARRVVVQVPCDQAIDAEVVETCTQLAADGYTIALDKFTPATGATALLPVADFLKVDFLATSEDEASACLAASRTERTINTVASHIEDVEVFDAAVREGFSHAQGFFFERPAVVRSEALPQGQISSLRLLCALNDPDLSLGSLEDLVKHDAALCYRILKTVNSAAFAQTREVTSMQHALLLLGRDTIRRWASLWVMAGLGAAAHNELVLMASVRGRFCEILTSKIKGEDAASEGFLLGMCSLLNVILHRPMAELVETLPLSLKTTDALIGRHNAERDLLECVIAYERGNWDACLPLIGAARLDRASLPAAYSEAVRWAHELVK